MTPARLRRLALRLRNLARPDRAERDMTREIDSHLRLLQDLTPLDPATFAAVGVMFLSVAAAACYLPARRAARVDPAIGLRA
jgi:ABC-type lipoprotein release transport system permease subunit